MSTRLDNLRRKEVFGKSSAIDAVFLKNKLMLESSGDEVIDNPYKKSDLAFICISTTAKAIAQVPIVAGDLKRNGDFIPVSYKDPWQRLISHPNYLQDAYSFTESIVSYLMLEGEIFIVPFPPAVSMPISLFVVRKKCMKPIKDDAGHLIGWEYNPKGFFNVTSNTLQPGSYPLSFDEVAHVWFFNPDDPFSGQPPHEAGKMNIVVDYKAAIYTSTFFDEGAVPGGMLSTDQKLSDKQYNRVKEQFETRHRGFRKGHRIGILEQGLKYTQTGLTQKDMEFQYLRDLSARRVFQIYGMKKAVISETDDLNYATSREERKEWWEGTNIPLIKMIESALNFTLFPQDSSRRIRYDLTVVEALKEALKEKVNSAYRLWQMGFTANEINTRMDLGFRTEPWRNRWYLPVNMVPVDAEGIPIPTGIPSKPAPPKEPPKAIDVEGEILSLKSGEDDENEARWQNFNNKIAPLEDQFTKKISRVFFEMRKRTLQLLYKDTKTAGDVDDELYSDEVKLLNKLTDPLYAEALSTGVLIMADELGFAISFNLSDPEAISFLSTKNLKIRGVVQTVKNKIHQELIESFQKGETIDQTADRIRSVFEVARSRARTIARTEITGAAQEGRSIAINRSGYKEKRWYTALDERVRPQHMAMHGRIVKVGEPWIFPDGTSVRHPSDYNGPAHQVINCFINPFVPILTSKGWKPIKDIVVGDLVLTHKNRFRKVDTISPRLKYNGEIIRIYPSNNKSNAISMTPEHPVLIGNDWKKAEDIKVGDKLKILASYCKRCGKPVPYWNKYCSNTCNSLDITDKQWSDPKHRKLMSKKTTEQLKREYSNGKRDRYKIGEKARESCFKKYGTKGYLGKVRNEPLFAEKVRKGVEDKYGSYMNMLKEKAFPELGKVSHLGSRLEKVVKDYLDAQGRNYTAQFSVGKRRIDFYLPDEKTFVEADGPTFHNNLKEERKRDLEILMEYPDHKISHVIFGDGPIRWETFDLLTLNHEGTFSQIEVSIEKIERKQVKKQVRLFNFSVEEDESYMAKGIVVHNCRCIEVIVPGTHYLD